MESTVSPVDVSKLSRACMSRERGNEVAEAVILNCRNAEKIIIDLDTAEVISLSFLDGLILTLNHSKMLERVEFQTEQEATFNKLMRVTEARSIGAERKPFSSRIRVFPKSVNAKQKT